MPARGHLRRVAGSNLPTPLDFVRWHRRCSCWMSRPEVHPRSSVRVERRAVGAAASDDGGREESMRRGKDRAVKGVSVALVVGVLFCAVAANAGVMAAESKEAKVDINEAGAKELMTVRGIGETLAKRIVAFREEHGPYNRAEDLMKVQGIGEKSLEKIRPYITVGKKS